MKGSLPFLVCAGFLAGCAQFPQVEALEGDRVDAAGYPRLVPLDQLTTAPESQITDDIEPDVLSRAARLKSRAAAIKARVVIDPATRKRMEEGIQPPE